MKLRILSLLAACLMLLTVFVACQDEGEGSGTGQVTTDGYSGQYAADVPKKNYNGATFTIMCRDPEMGWGEMAIVSDDQGVTVLEDAAYNRNARLEADYGIKMEFYTFLDSLSSGDTFYKTLFENLNAQDDIADICIPGIIDAAALAPMGLFYDLSGGDLPYVDLSNPWWNQSINDSLKIVNRQYFAINDALLNDKLDTYVMFFNKTVFDDKQMEYPYSMVDDGTWTIDAFYNMAVTHGSDLNFNGVEDYEDAFGLVGLVYDIFYVGSGITGAALDEEGIPYMREYDAKTDAVFSKAVKILSETSHLNYGVGQEPLLNNDINDTFAAVFDQKTMFMCGPLGFYFSIITDMESDVGLLPCPKYDEAQTRYYHRAGYNGATAITVLTTVKDKERAGILLEAFSAESKNYISPAFYETLLTDRYAQDEESKAMISLVIETEIFDLDQIFRWGAMLEQLQGLAARGQGSAATVYGRFLAIAKNKLETTVEGYRELISLEKGS